MARKQRRYPPEFRREIVGLVRSGRSPEALAREFEPSASAIRKWVKQADLDEGHRSDGLTTFERQELRQARREIKRLRMERDILKKTAAWFARESDSIPGKDSRRVKAHRAQFPIRVMCRVLGLSPSGYYAWLKRLPSNRARQDQALREKIVQIWNENRRVYGRPRLHAELRARGERTSPKRVGRLMREAGIQGASRRHRKAGLTRRDRDARPAPDLVNRNFAAEGPDQLWVADLTYVRTKAGWLYVAVVLDAWSRLVVGWAMETHLRSELVEKALAMAVIRRQPKQVIHHSDQGAQYTSTAFGKRCREAGVRPSMGSVGDAYDNAMCESFFATLECELLDCHQFRNPNQARRAVFDFIEGFYNRRRRHSALGYESPVRYEQQAA